MNLEKLSDVQRRAVMKTEGPVLVLAGAGSGKTSVLTHRVAYLIEDKGVDPSRILAITFTNKAAKEMKERIAKLTAVDTSYMMVSTFHSMCARFLRYDAEKLGYQPGYSIYDSSDSMTIVKRLLKDMDVDAIDFKPFACRAAISSAKNCAGKMTPEEYLEENEKNADTMIQLYHDYQDTLRRENAMDFDDLLLNVLNLLETNDALLSYYQNKYDYILVDEYQDTNSVQYGIVKLLAAKHRNLFAVGDDDQSIYAWRGADIQNILNFEKDYPECEVVKLEQNYRSTSAIIEVASHIISQTLGRKEKRVWSARTDGAKPIFKRENGEYDEAEFVTREIYNAYQNGRKLSDFAVLYRKHSQSRVIEEKLRIRNIPYRVVGGMSFYERKEIKDILSYLELLANPAADTAMARIINVPRRKIGDVTVDKVRDYAAEKGITMLDALKYAEEYAPNAASRLMEFGALMDGLAKDTAGMPVEDIISEVYNRTGYSTMLMLDGSTEAQTRMENIAELVDAAEKFTTDSAEEPNLENFLASVSLFSGVDEEFEDGEVALMTIHGAKGLEFDTVFMIGMEEETLPTAKSILEGNTDEERRLCYVGMTRAKQTLYLTCCTNKRTYNSSSRHVFKQSRFITDIPPELLDDRTDYNYIKAASTPSMKNRPKFTTPEKEPIPQAQTNAAEFSVGDRVKHNRFGEGTITQMLGAGEQTVAIIDFAMGQKKLFLAYAPIHKI